MPIETLTLSDEPLDTICVHGVPLDEQCEWCYCESVKQAWENPTDD